MFSKNRLILILGILIALMPFLGFPTIWKNFFYFVFGIAVSTLSFLMARHKRISRKNYTRREKSTFPSKKEIVQSDYAEQVQETESLILDEQPVSEEVVSEEPIEPISDLTQEQKETL